MTKKILAAVIAVMMVMALSISVFAVDILTDDVKGVAQNANVTLAIPTDLVIEDGATVTLHVKGTADNEMIRFYLTDPSDNGRVTEVMEVPVEGGAFEATSDLVIDMSGTIQGTAAPSIVMVKGKDYTDAPNNLVLEVVELSIAGQEEAAPAETEAEPEAEAEAPEAEAEAAPAETETETEAAPEAEAAPAPAETTPAAPATGIALCVIPAVVALGAVAVSKKH